MIVYCNSYIDELPEEDKLVLEFLDGLIYYFQNMTFGNSLNEMVFTIKSGREDFMKYYEIYRKYKPRKKTYSSLFSLDYEKIQILGTKEMLEYVKNTLTIEIQHIKDYKLQDFDCDAFLFHLEKYFIDALATVLAGKSPSEGKVLNEDIKDAMRQKFLKL